MLVMKSVETKNQISAFKVENRKTKSTKLRLLLIKSRVVIKKDSTMNNQNKKMNNILRSSHKRLKLKLKMRTSNRLL
jgi:hypothetical protein